MHSGGEAPRSEETFETSRDQAISCTRPCDLSWVSTDQFPESGFNTATCDKLSTIARKATVWPSGETWGLRATLEPPSRSPDQRSGGVTLKLLSHHPPMSAKPSRVAAAAHFPTRPATGCCKG